MAIRSRYLESRDCTRALSGFDVKDFNVSLSRGETVVFSSRKYGDIAGTPITCSAGSGYLLTAESCTEGEAERTNSGWGQARLAGNVSFTVKPVEATEVTLKCALANSSVNVVFSDFIKKNLSDYAIALHAADASSRSFTFDKNNYSTRPPISMSARREGPCNIPSISLCPARRNLIPIQTP